MRQEGFSLIELLIVLGIIGILASVIVIRSDLLQADTQVSSSAKQIVNLSKMARQNSVSVAEYKGIFPSYGLHFDDSEPHNVTVYVNCIPDDGPNEGGDGEVNHLDNFAFNAKAHTDCQEAIGSTDPELAKVEDVLIENRAFITKITAKEVDGDEVEVGSFSINYLRPEPTVWITVDGSDFIPAGYVKVTLRDRSQKYEKDIIFYTSALVETTSRRRIPDGS